MSSRSETYREKAEECVRAAAEASDPKTKATWLEMAQQWMLLATSRDQRTANGLKLDGESKTGDGSSQA